MSDQHVVWKSNPGPQQAMIACPVFEIFFGGARGGGKLCPMDTKILTPKGFVVMADIRVGDSVSDPTTGGATKVIGVYPQGIKKIWKLTFDDGASTEVGDEHLWAYREANRKRPKTKRSSQREFAARSLDGKSLTNRWDNYRIGTTEQLRTAFEAGRGIRIPLTEPVSFTANGKAGTGDIEPYLAGLMIGDGSCGSLQMTCCDDEIREYLISKGFSAHGALHTDGKPKSFGVSVKSSVDQWLRNNGLRHSHSWEKFIPPYVKTTGIEYRLAFLQGLMDTDGTADERGRCYFISTSKQLSEDLQWLVRSLGGKASIRQRQTYFTYKGEKKAGRPSWQVRIWHGKLSSFFRLSRKKARANDAWNGGYELTRELTGVEYVGEKEAQCIRVDSMYGLYIADDFIVTHNTAGMLGEWAVHASLYAEKANGLMVRRSLVELQDTIRESKIMYGPIGATYNETGKKWTMPNGATLTFAFLENDEDATRYQGFSATRLYCEEIGNFPNPDPIMKLKAILRSTHGVPVGFRATGNPGGPGHGWVRARYVDPAPLGYSIIKDEQGLERIFIPSRVQDNPALMASDPTYIQRLKASGSKELVRAWLEGDWSVITGAYFPEFSMSAHVIPTMDVPPHWTRIRSMDWGSAAPFAVLWAAVSDGEPLTDSAGKQYWLPVGSLVVYREWYGWNGTPNKGCKMMAQEVGAGIREMELGEHMDDEVLDPSAFASDGGPSIAERLDLNFRRADNKRVARLGVSGGWDALRERLRGTDTSEHKPLLYFMNNCVHSIRTLPALQHDPLRPEDADTEGDDHCCDAARYLCLSRPLTRKKVQPESRRWATQLTFNEIVKRATNKRLELE